LTALAAVAKACEGGGGGGECATKPTATVKAASSVTHYSAYINGEVNPNGCETTYYFEFRKSGGLWSKGFTGSAGSVNFAVPVSEWEAPLTPLTKYEFRLKANSAAGSAESSVSSFTTLKEPEGGGSPPTVSTEAATGITSTGATLNGSVNPNSLATTYTFEYGTVKGSFSHSTTPVSAGSGATSVKVKAELGLEPETTYYFRISATNSANTSKGSELSFTTSAAAWKIKESPNPSATSSKLYDVSCEPSTSLCTQVGTSTTSGVDSPLAQRWNGTSWSEQTAAKKGGATHTRLFGVDCPSETRCLAAGNSQSAEGASVLSEIWNEGKWAVQTTPAPAESTSSEFVAIGCNSTATCTAVGSAVIGGVKTAIAERWTSPTWAASTIPIPAGALSSQLDGVDCLWSNFCVAVGRYTTSGGSIESLVEFWNGTNWSIQSVADPENAVQSTLLDVSCTPTPNRCTAVGGWKNSSSEQFTLAYRFNGVTTWTLQSTPNPSGSIASVFQEVSCATETSCTGAGSWVSGSGGSNRTLAEIWNGTSWSIQASSNPVGAVFSAFFGVSCRGTSCFGAGWSTNGSGVDTTLSEFRE
jgi:hypothetical protein